MSAPASTPSAPASGSPPPVIELVDASFGYAASPVVRGVTLSIAPGEVVALLGANGSGKSTLVKGLLGLNEQLGGTTRLFGVPREDFSDHPRLGYVPQHHSLSASVRATVEEIVETGRLSHHRWWQPRLVPTRDAGVIARCLDTVGLADRATADVSTLSGGQQRRVLIARAMASHPDALLMDEPTAGVDAANQEVLVQVLARLADSGTTLVIVTHELEALADVVTRIVVMQGGEVAFDGSPAQYRERRGDLRPGGHDHHHDDEEPATVQSLPGAPTAGPFDRLGRERRG